MARTLIIKNADFSENKVTTVTFGGIPCEGIELEDDTMTITGLDPVTVEYTLTPADTTDSVTWASSDTSVVSVNAGILTINGIGEATLTATCGDFSASMTITVDIAIVPLLVDGCSCALNTSTTPNTVSTNTATRIVATGGGNQATYYGSISTSQDYTNLKAIKIPGNAERIKVSITSNTMFYNSNQTSLIFTKDEWAGIASYDYAIKPVSQVEYYNIITEMNKVIDIPTGADSFYFVTRLNSNYTSADLANAGFKLEFLPAAS